DPGRPAAGSRRAAAVRRDHHLVAAPALRAAGGPGAGRGRPGRPGPHGGEAGRGAGRARDRAQHFGAQARRRAEARRPCLPGGGRRPRRPRPGPALRHDPGHRLCGARLQRLPADAEDRRHDGPARDPGAVSGGRLVAGDGPAPAGRVPDRRDPRDPGDARLLRGQRSGQRRRADPGVGHQRGLRAHAAGRRALPLRHRRRHLRLSVDPVAPGAAGDPDASAAAAARDHRRGVLAMALAVAVLCLMDACLKQLAGRYPPLQVAALRGLVGLPMVLAWAAATTGLRALVRVHWPLHLLRGVLGVLFLGCFVAGLGQLPMSTAYAITFVGPLLVTAMAVPLLREHVGPRRWTAIVAGIAGVLVVLRPGGEGVLTSAGLLVLFATACYAASVVTVRMLAQRDSAQALVFWFLAMVAVGAGLLALPGWVPLRAADAWLLAGVAVTGTLGQIALTHAFR